jgi:hypothetical protein
LLLKKRTIPPILSGVGAFTGFLIFFAIGVINSCAKVTIFAYHIFSLPGQTPQLFTKSENKTIRPAILIRYVIPCLIASFYTSIIHKGHNYRSFLFLSLSETD